MEDTNDYLKFDRISDDVFAISPSVVLKFTVSLSKISGGKRYHYHKEYEYPNKTINKPLVSIKRSFDYYLSFESNQKMDDGNKLFVRIGAQEILRLISSMDEVVRWFNDKAYEKLFIVDRTGKLIMAPPIPKDIIVANLPMDKYIIFSPTIVDKGVANADKEPGVKITFGSPETCIDITLDKFMGLKYTISNFNLYQSAAILINYIGRPESSINRYVIGQDSIHTMYQTPDIMEARSVNERFIPGTANISSLEG